MQHRGDYRVSVTKDYLVFAAAHFITFSGHRCETLHGHNYRVGVVVEGKLQEHSWYVFDFGVLKRIMRKLCDDIDHKVLLPTTNPHLQIAATDWSVSSVLDTVVVAGGTRPRTCQPTNGRVEICNSTYTDPRQRQLFKNIIYVGALSALLDIDPGVIEKLFSEQYKGKEKLLDSNDQPPAYCFAPNEKP